MASTGALVEGSPRSQELAWLKARDGEWWEEAFDRIAAGEAPSMVAAGVRVRYAIFLRAILENEARAAQYDAVLRAAAEKYAHELVEIADGAKPEEVRHAKLRMEARQWTASRWHRARYGDAVTVDVTKRVVLDLRFGRVEPGTEARVIEHERAPLLPGVKAEEIKEI